MRRSLPTSLALVTVHLSSVLAPAPADAQFREGSPLASAPTLPAFATHGDLEEALYRADRALDPAPPPVPEGGDDEKVIAWLDRDLLPWSRVRFGAIEDVIPVLRDASEGHPGRRVVALTVQAMLLQYLGQQILMMFVATPSVSSRPEVSRELVGSLATQAVDLWRAARDVYRRAAQVEDAPPSVREWIHFADTRAGELDRALARWDAEPIVRTSR